jgi:hypothetical protein
MQIDPAIVSALSALVGALIGGGASVTAAIYTQRYQDRLQRVAREATKREAVYADFIMHASKLRADSDEAGHAFQPEAGHLFRREAGRDSDLMSATAWRRYGSME